MDNRVVKFTRDGIREENTATGEIRMLTRSDYGRQTRYAGGQTVYSKKGTPSPNTDPTAKAAALAGRKRAAERSPQRPAQTSGQKQYPAEAIPLEAAKSPVSGHWDDAQRTTSIVESGRGRSASSSGSKASHSAGRFHQSRTRLTPASSHAGEAFRGKLSAGSIHGAKAVSSFAGKLGKRALSGIRKSQDDQEDAGGEAAMAAGEAALYTGTRATVKLGVKSVKLAARILKVLPWQYAPYFLVHKRGNLPVPDKATVEASGILGTGSSALTGKGSFHPVQALRNLAAKNAPLFLAVLLLLLCVIQSVPAVGSALAQAAGSENTALPAEVTRYQSLVWEACGKEGMTEYTELVLCVIMRESGGQGTDPMQSSESVGLPPNGITDPRYSIEVGVRYLAACLRAAAENAPAGEGSDDLIGIRLALQGYNFGAGYIPWAMERGGYTRENAEEYSAQKAQELGWQRYGDPGYPEHVLLYYRGGEAGGMKPGGGPPTSGPRRASPPFPPSGTRTGASTTTGPSTSRAPTSTAPRYWPPRAGRWTPPGTTPPAAGAAGTATIAW